MVTLERVSVNSFEGWFFGSITTYFVSMRINLTLVGSYQTSLAFDSLFLVKRNAVNKPFLLLKFCVGVCDVFFVF